MFRLKRLFYLKFGNAISRFFGECANIHLPYPLNVAILGFLARRLSMNLNEARQPLRTFHSFNALFTRELTQDARTIDPDSKSIVSPCDGRIEQFGPLTTTSSGYALIQAKGLLYDLDSFIPDHGLQHGHFMTIYLSPKDCHRVFSPLDGRVTKLCHVPGKLLPVREPFISQSPRLYSENERLVIEMATAFGRAFVVMVGATNVGSISVPFDESIATNTTNDYHTILKKDYSESVIQMNKGDHLATFHLGSTVVLLIENPAIKWNNFSLNNVQYGQKIAEF